MDQPTSGDTNSPEETNPTPFPPQLKLGETVFLETGGEKGCQECHGSDGKGNEIGPDIRGQPIDEIRFQLDENVDMEDVVVSEEEIQAVAFYLAWLETQP